VSTRCAGDYHGIDIGWLDRNPALGIKKPRLGEVRSWSDSEIAAFETRWPVGTRERLAFGLMLFTGQRPTDVFRMTWADINGDEIRVIRQSGGSSPG
jgi:integrase